MEISLLPHQQVCLDEAINAISQGKRHILLHAGFGLGKTYMAYSIAEYIANHHESESPTILVLCNPRKVVDWEIAYEKYFGCPVSDEDCIMSIDTVWRRNPKLYDIVIIDESQFLKVDDKLELGSNRSEFVHKWYHNASNLIMLSGAPFYHWENSFGQYSMLDKSCNGDFKRKQFLDTYIIRDLQSMKIKGKEKKFWKVAGVKNENQLKD